MDFNSSKTKTNLAKSYAAECQAGARYQFMATQAQLEKFTYIKDTMKMIAKNEMAHAKVFYDYILEKSGGNCEVDLEADYPYIQPELSVSLQEEAEVERQEFEKIYPKFAEVARKEGFNDIAESFELIAGVEKTHAGILDYLTELYSSKSLYKREQKTLFKCSNCGHIAYQTEGWKKCPLCNMDQGAIMLDYSQVMQECLCGCSGTKSCSSNESKTPTKRPSSSTKKSTKSKR